MKSILIERPYPGLEIRRGEKILLGRLLEPHLVVSTCRVNGGLKDDLLFVVNHQACEPKPCPGWEEKKCLAVRDPQGYHRLVCEYHHLPPEKTALLGTAANMALAGFAREVFPIPGTQEELVVFAVVTAGVETNAGRAGDPARIYEWEGRFEPVPEPEGTINIMVFVNQELAPCALIRAVKMVTEAKTSVLQELSVPSRYSSGLATGTGTDQVALASLRTERPPLRGAGKHVKLGELLARAVRAALKEALARQNKRTPETIRYVPRLLERFGLGEEAFFARLRKHLREPLLAWLHRNRRAVLSDTVLVASVLAYLEVWDQVLWGVIPKENAREAFLLQGAALAVSLAGRPGAFEDFYHHLSSFLEPEEILLAAISLGFEEKWQVPYFDLKP